MAVPYTFANATVSIPLSELDSNFATTITLGNTAIELGNTVTTLNNMTLANVTVSSGNATFTTANVTNMSSSNVTITGGTIANVTISGSGSNITATNINASNVTVSTDLTLSGGTANGVAYLNGSKVLTSGSALTFDGSKLTNTAAAGGVRFEVISTTSSPEVSITSADTGTSRINFGGTTAPKKGAFVYSDNSDLFFWSLNSGSEQMRLTSTGLGIGTSSPSSKLEVVEGGTGSGYGGIVAATATAGGNAGYTFRTGGTNRWMLATIGSAGSESLRFYDINNSSERMRIDSSGTLLVGKTSTASELTTKGSYIAPYGYISLVTTGGSVCGVLSNDTDGDILRIYRTSTKVGSISNTATATAYNTSSDYRLKENIQPMQGALDVVAQLNPVRYTWKADGSDGQGFIAHELQAVVPDCVTGEKDAVDADGKPVYQGIDTSFLVATLTKAIQEQQEQINQLKAEVAALKGK